jgi:hypothetical protein
MCRLGWQTRCFHVMTSSGSSHCRQSFVWQQVCIIAM